MDALMETRAKQWFENLDNKIHEILTFIESESPPLEKVSNRVASLKDEVKNEENHTFGFVFSDVEEIAFEFALFEIETQLQKALETESCNKCFRSLIDAELVASYYLKQFQPVSHQIQGTI